MPAKVNQSKLYSAMTECKTGEQSQQDYLQAVNRCLLKDGEDQISISTLRKYVSLFKLPSDRSHSRKQQQSRRVDFSHRAKQAMTKAGHEVTQVEEVRIPRKNSDKNETRPRVRYTLERTRLPECREYCGLTHEQDATWIGKAKPSLKSLTPEARVQYLHRLCEQNTPKLSFIREEKLKIEYLYLEGKFTGYRGRVSLAELRKGVSNDPRSLTDDEERMRWLKLVALPGCTVETASWPAGAGGIKKVNYICPNGHSNSVTIGSILSIGGHHIICQACNNVYSMETKLIDNRNFRSEVVQLYLTQTLVHGNDDVMCDQRDVCPFDTALKIGLFKQAKLKYRSKKYFGDPRLAEIPRGIAYIVEQTILENYSSHRLALRLEACGHHCDGYSEMIDHSLDHDQIWKECLELANKIGCMRDDEILSLIKRCRRSNFRRGLGTHDTYSQ